MRRYFTLVLLGAFLVGCFPVGQTPDPTKTPRAILTITPKADVQVLPKTDRPNILFILTDDLDLELGTIDYMPHLQELLTSQGLTVNDFFISQPLCCPSRSTFLRGQYTHNHGVYRNEQPYGGFEEFYKLQNESSTLATWLQAAGYRTVMLGKYLNGYPFPEDRSYIPVGWNEWYSSVKGSPFAGYQYTLNENGQQIDYNVNRQGEAQYMTDVLARKAGDFIQRASADKTPFFVYLSTYAPHVPVKPAPKYAALMPDLKAPRTASFNEADVSDKPPGLRYDPLLSDAEIKSLDEEYRARVLAMLSVDDMIAQLVDVLQANNQLDNTYIIFTSDNGYRLGQHRLRSGKDSPYEEDIHVPFIIRGPGIAPNTNLQDYITGNVDFAPTVADLAGVIPPDYVDGKSMVGLFNPERPKPKDWRSGYLLEFYGYNQEGEDPNVSPRANYLGLRTDKYLYVKYQDGFVELYDLIADPYELENIAATADPALLEHLSAWLKALSTCAGVQCRELDKDASE